LAVPLTFNVLSADIYMADFLWVFLVPVNEWING
jgi:hypothetical protein